MSPPIYAPDGSEVSEIVLPDGSTASEVIGPDGNVVFEAGPDIPDSGVLRLTFDDDSDSTTAIDSWNNHDGTINGGTYTTTTVRQGSAALSLDGIDDIVVGGKPQHTDSFTKMGWVYFNNIGSSNQRIFTENSETIAYVRVNSGVQSFSIYDGASDSYRIDTNVSLSSGTWYHFAYGVDNDNSEAYAYLGGSQIGSSTSGQSFTLNGTYRLGSKRDGINYLDGILDDYREYDRLLTQSEIQDIINNTS